jgi:phosphatidate cytidylyltransferase
MEPGMTSDAAEEGSKQKQSVGLRWLTALTLIPIILIFVWFGSWVAFVALVVIVVLGILELQNMMYHVGYHLLTWISIALSCLFLLAAMLPQQQLLILQIAIGGALLASFSWLFFRKDLQGALVDWAFTLAFPIYLGWSMSFFLVLRGNIADTIGGPGGAWITFPSGTWWVLVVLLGVWGFDSAAFFTGRYLGRHKVAPQISPGKTWEGIAGGMVLSVIAALICTVRQLAVPWYLAILLGLFIGSAAVLGDLAESLIKRQMHVKDSGHILPGHGGVLDRIDSLLFAVFVVYIFSQFVGR